jgi:hypothetical protein
VDLFGDQTVQVVTTLLQVACVLLAAVVVVLSVRRASTGDVPVRAVAPVQICLRQADDINRLPAQTLPTALPARAPPDPVQRHPRDRRRGR